MISRLYDENKNATIDIKAVDHLIAQARDNEFLAVKWLRDSLSWEEEKGLCHGSYNWWYGLSLLYQGNNAEALAPLKIALHSDSKKERLILLAADSLKLNNAQSLLNIDIKPQALYL